MGRVGVERKGRSVSSSSQHGQIRGYLNTQLLSWLSWDGSRPATLQMLDPLRSTAGTDWAKHIYSVSSHAKILNEHYKFVPPSMKCSYIVGRIESPYSRGLNGIDYIRLYCILHRIFFTVMQLNCLSLSVHSILLVWVLRTQQSNNYTESMFWKLLTVPYFRCSYVIVCFAVLRP